METENSSRLTEGSQSEQSSRRWDGIISVRSLVIDDEIARSSEAESTARKARRRASHQSSIVNKLTYLPYR